MVPRLQLEKLVLHCESRLEFAGEPLHQSIAIAVLSAFVEALHQLIAVAILLVVVGVQAE